MCFINQNEIKYSSVLFYHSKSQKKIAKLALKEKKYDTKAYVSPVFGQFAIGIPLKIIIENLL